MNSLCGISFPINLQNRSRLDQIVILTNHPLPRRNFPFPVTMQVFAGEAFIVLRPSREKLLSAYLFTGAAVNVFHIVKFLQTAVVPAAFLQVNGLGSVFGVEVPDGIGIVCMGFFHM